MTTLTHLARPYAKAAFEFSMAERRLRSWSNMLSFLSALVSHPKMQKFLRDPRLTAEQRTELLKECFRSRPDMAQENFLKLLAQYKRLFVLPAIQVEFEKLVAKHKGVETVKVITAFPLSSGPRRLLEKKLAKRLEKQIVIETEIDASLIAGAIIYAQDQMFDLSLKYQLQCLAEQLL